MNTEFAMLVSQAPYPPPDWFKPDMPPRPMVDRAWKWCEGCRADSDCLGNADCQKITTVRREQAHWDELERQERIFQWPPAWAVEVHERCMQYEALH